MSHSTGRTSIRSQSNPQVQINDGNAEHEISQSNNLIRAEAAEAALSAYKLSMRKKERGEVSPTNRDIRRLIAEQSIHSAQQSVAAIPGSRKKKDSCSFYLENKKSDIHHLRVSQTENSLLTLKAHANDLRKHVQSMETSIRQVRVYHFTDTSLGPLLPSIENENIKYTNLEREELSDVLPTILMESTDTNRSFGRTLLVFCFGIQEFTKDFVDLVESIIKDFHAQHSDISLNNITIYNAVESPGTALTKQLHKSAVRKVVNVILLDEGPEYNIAMFKFGETNYSDNTTIHMISHVDIPRARYSADTSFVQNYIYSQWWYMLFTKTPLCADGRLIQTQGTCWWNASANILILTDTIATMLKTAWLELPIKYKNCINGISLDSCPSKNIPPIDFMYVLVNQIVVKGNRALDKSVDFSSDGSALFSDVIKKDVRKLDDRDYQTEKKKTGMADSYKRLALNGGSLIHAFMVFMTSLFTRGPDFNNLLWVDRLEDPVGDDLIRKFIFNPESMDVIGAGWLPTWKEFPYPQLVILNTQFAPVLVAIPLEITVNGHVYDLEAAGIEIASDKVPDHVIAGLSCHTASKTQRYVFDSNNITSYDDWTQLVPENRFPGYGEDREDIIAQNIKANKQNDKAMKEYTSSFEDTEPWKFSRFRFLLYIFRSF